MIIIDALLVAAMLFFLFLPITDRKTVRMKLCMLLAIAAVLAVSVTWRPTPDVQIASAGHGR
jgi:high-affinity Fe2+/Pb2+ permease